MILTTQASQKVSKIEKVFLKPVCFEPFQTKLFFFILNALEKCSYIYY